MEMKIMVGNSDKPESASGKESFPMGMDWKKEVGEHLEMAQRVLKDAGDDRTAARISEILDMALSELDYKEEPEADNEDVKGMEDSKKKEDYMSKLTSEDEGAE